MSTEAQADLAGLQDALLNTDSIEQFLHELAELAARTAGHDMSCGIAVRQRGRSAPVSGCSDPLASEADRIQAETGDGPALRALRDARPQRVHDTTTEKRWPRFCRQAAELGVRSCYALPLITGGELAGRLALYGRSPGAFGPEEIERAERFARHASGPLTLALRMATCADQNGQLRSSIMSRAVIDQALGVIMATQRCTQDKAFALLRSVSQNTNVKLRDLAASIVSNVSGEPPQPAAAFEDG